MFPLEFPDVQLLRHLFAAKMCRVGAIPRHLGRVFPGHLENMYLVEALNVPWQDDQTTFARGHLPCLKTCHCMCMYIIVYVYVIIYVYYIHICVYV